MTAAEAQQFLRQQLSYAKLLLDRLGQEEAIPAKRAILQSVLFGLNLGLSQYFSSLFSAALSGSSPVSLALIASQNVSSEGSGLQQEFSVLMAEGAWLRAFSDTVDSLPFLPKQWSSKPKASTQIQIIASSSDSGVREHWTRLDKAVVLEWLSYMDELLERHTSASQEY